MAVLGASEFTRLRIGVGHPGRADEVVDYVLQSPPADERLLIEEAIEQALAVFPLVLAGEMEQAMNTLHRRVRAAASDPASTGSGPGTQES
jgi:PTH1 family peptidyl-tRNA hydrolase